MKSTRPVLAAAFSVTWNCIIGVLATLGFVVVALLFSRTQSDETYGYLTEYTANGLLDLFIELDVTMAGLLFGLLYSVVKLVDKHRQFLSLCSALYDLRQFLLLRQKRMASQGVGAAHSPSGEDTAP